MYDWMPSDQSVYEKRNGEGISVDGMTKEKWMLFKNGGQWTAVFYVEFTRNEGSCVTFTGILHKSGYGFYIRQL